MNKNIQRILGCLHIDWNTTKQMWREEGRKLVLVKLPLGLMVGALSFGTYWFRGSLAKLLTAQVMLPLWVIIAVLPLSWALLAALAIFIIRRKRITYSRDEFFGLDWSWRYQWDGRIRDLSAWCPVCRKRIEFRNDIVGKLLGSENRLCKNCKYDPTSKCKEEIPWQPASEVIRRIEKRIDEKRFERKYGIARSPK